MEIGAKIEGWMADRRNERRVSKTDGGDAGWIERQVSRAGEGRKRGGRKKSKFALKERLKNSWSGWMERKEGHGWLDVAGGKSCDDGGDEGQEQDEKRVNKCSRPLQMCQTVFSEILVVIGFDRTVSWASVGYDFSTKAAWGLGRRNGVTFHNSCCRVALEQTM